MFQPTEAVLIRASSCPRDLALPEWPDLTGGGQPRAWLEWLVRVWALPGFAAAVESAAPGLAAQVTRALDGEVPARPLRRLIEAIIRYLLRWMTRPTPFGRFAGTVPARLGPRASAVWGERHHAVIRPDEEFIAGHAARIEQSPGLLRRAAVMTNSLGFPRGGKWVLPCYSTGGDGRVLDAEIELTAPIRLAVETAAVPVRFADLAAKMAAAYPAEPVAAERLLAGLVREGVLLADIRPPMTVTEPAAYLSLSGPGGQAAVDLRLDCAVTIPPAVTAEACEAASALVAVAPAISAWASYHARFIERWGPGAAVPVREVLQVLGFPSGYMSPARRSPAIFTGRDAVLAATAQQSALDGCTEVILTDDLISQLRCDRPPVPHTEIRFTIAAGTARDLDCGRFVLTVVSGARHAGVAAARFLHLLKPDELERFRHVYAGLPPVMPDADIVQISAPPLQTRLAALARVPGLLPVLPVGDFHPDPPRSLADLAVSGDGQRLWLMSLATGRPVEPLLLNAVLLGRLQQPIVRFLTEIWTAFTAAPSRFDWGTQHDLPFLPRVRRGRSILHPARWTVPRNALPPGTATWKDWHAAWQRCRERRHLPRQVLLLGHGDERLGLDLDETAHLAILRTRLRSHDAVLTEAPGRPGWTDGRPAEILLTITDDQPRHAPRPARRATTACHRPGHSGWIEARMYGRCDDMLTRLALPDGWWYIRYPDPEPHLRIRVPLRSPARFASMAGSLARQADQLHDDGLLSDCTLHPYRPETRHGTGPVLAAAEAVFAADSRAAVRVLTQPGTDRQAAAAAGMITIAGAFTADGMTWLTRHIPRHSGPRLEESQLALARARYGDALLAEALDSYRTLTDRDRLDADRVLADLLHLHHARIIGPDPASERHCLRLARATALTDLARRMP